MPDTVTTNTSVQEINKEIERLQRLKRELLAQLPESSSPLTRFLVKQLEKKIEQIERKIVEAQKKLEEKITATDLITPEILDKVKDAAGEAIKGNTDEALDQLEEAGKDIVVNETKELIDEKVKDESIKETLKEVVDEVREGDLEGAVDTVKEGIKEEVKEEAGELVDKHIKDPKIAALIKDVIDGVVEGEFEDLFEVVSDGVIDIAKDKLQEFVVKLLNQLKEKIYLEVEERLKAEVKTIINDSLMEVAKELGANWTVQLAASVGKRLFKRAVGIIKEEIKLLATRQTFDILLGVLQDAAIATLESGLKGRKLTDILKELLQHAIKHPEFKKLIKESKERMMRKFVEAAVQEVGNITEQVLDAYLRVNGTWTGPAFNMAKKDLKIGPWWGCVNLVLSASADIKTSVEATRKGIGAELKADVSGVAYAGVGIEIGYDLPIVGDISIEGGIKGGPKLSAYARTMLVVKDNKLDGELKPFNLDLDMVALLYLETPLPNSIVKYVPAYLEKATVVGSNINYPLGKMNVLQVRTPTYGITVDPYKKGYVFTRKTGNYDIQLNPTVKAYIKSVKDSIVQAANEAWEMINPANIDLNPFDEEGWIGSWFH